MGVPPVDLAPMTVEDFFAFTDTRPDEEKWELIDGEPILNASPSDFHQWIVGNLVYLLGAIEREKQQPWKAIPGIGVRISDNSLPQPDVIIRPRAAPSGNPMSRECDDMVVAFEILSPSTRDRDLRWKRKAYLGLPSLTYYIVIAQDAVDVMVFGRETELPGRLDRLDDSLELPSLGISLPLSEIYRGTGLGERPRA
jgi:Uma2 family endonuclease